MEAGHNMFWDLCEFHQELALVVHPERKAEIPLINMGATLTLEKHFLSCVNKTAFPEPGRHTRAISLRHDGYRSQFFFLDPILKGNKGEYCVI